MSFWRKERDGTARPEPGELAERPEDIILEDSEAQEAPPRSEWDDADVVVRGKMAEMLADGEPGAADNAIGAAQAGQDAPDEAAPHAAGARRTSGAGHASGVWHAPGVWRQALRGLRRLVPALLITLAYVVLVFCMFRNVAAASRGDVSMSLRYSTPIAPDVVASTKNAIRAAEQPLDYSAAYWQASPREMLTSTRGEVETPVLFVDGEMPWVMQVDFLFGGYPGALEGRGLALSEGLAWQLFGGANVVGTQLEWMGGTYTVRGVFAGDGLLLLAQVNADDTTIPGFSGVELNGRPEGEPRQKAEAFVQEVGLPAPNVMVGANIVPVLVGVMAWLPVVIVAVWFLGRLIMLLRQVAYWKRQLVWFALLLAAAFALPRALALLPGWVVPSQWSDMSHWSAFFAQMDTRVTEWLSLVPSFADVEAKKLLIGQVLLLVPALFAVLVMIRLWAGHMRRKDTQSRVAQIRQARAAEDEPQKTGLPEGQETPQLPLPTGGEAAAEEAPEGYQSEFCDVRYDEELNLAFVKWKKFCSGEQYRQPLRQALAILAAHNGCNYCADTRDGFENEQADTQWLFDDFLPKAAKTTCKKIFFITGADNALQAELDGQSAELGKLFDVHYCAGLEDVKQILDES